MWCEGLCGIVTCVLLAIIAVLILHYVYLLWNSDYWKKLGIFCPNSKALFGNLPGQINGKSNIMYDLDDLYQKYKGKHSCIGIYNFRQPRLLVFDPEIIKDIMIKYFKNFQGTEFHGKIDRSSDPLFGNHPFFLVGDEWKEKRAEISPAFTNTRTKAIFPITQEVNAKMIEYIKKEIAKKDHDGLDAKDLSARFTISIVSNSIYNVDPKSFDGEESEILKKSQSFTTPTKKFIIYMMMATVYPFLTKFIKFGFSQPGAENFFIELMDKAVKFREESKIQRMDYLDHLINLKKKKEISDLDIASHGASFLVDGFDTSSAAISSTLYELAKNKHVQTKLREEINNAIPIGEPLTYDTVVNLEYLDQVWNESLRIHSPATHLTRLCNEPIEIDLPKDKKLFFEKNSVILFPVVSLHMDPEHFPEPEKFIPERFSAENGGAKAFLERGVFMPFGIGPRICVGNRFAVSQSKLAIVGIIRQFEVSVNPKTPEKFVIHPQALIADLIGCYLDFKEIQHN